MPSTHSNLLVHMILSTKNRLKLIADVWRPELFSYMGGVVDEHKASLLEAGGIEDHVHLVVRIHPSFAIADTVRLIKASSSRWINEDSMPTRCENGGTVALASRNDGTSDGPRVCADQTNAIARRFPDDSRTHPRGLHPGLSNAIAPRLKTNTLRIRDHINSANRVQRGGHDIPEDVVRRRTTCAGPLWMM